MDASVFYYTYSTIAQTLASAFGFLVAVVLFRMDRISANVKIYEHRRGQVQKNMQLSGKPPEGQDSPYLNQYRSIREAEEAEGKKITRMKCDLRRSLRWTGGTIMASIVIMAMTPGLLWINPWIAWAPLIVVVSTSLYTLWTYMILTVEVTKSS